MINTIYLKEGPIFNSNPFAANVYTCTLNISNTFTTFTMYILLLWVLLLIYIFCLRRLRKQQAIGNIEGKRFYVNISWRLVSLKFEQTNINLSFTNNFSLPRRVTLVLSMIVLATSFIGCLCRSHLMDLGWLNLCICNKEKISYGLGKYCASMRQKPCISF